MFTGEEACVQMAGREEVMANAIRIFVGWLAAAIMCANGLPAIAQSPEPSEAAAREFDRDCMDDYGRDLCDSGRWSAIVSSFGLEPAERVQEQGWRGVRVFTIDGYSRDMPMVSVLNRGTEEYGFPIDPVLEIRRAAGPDEVKVAVPLRREAWYDLYLEAMQLQELVAASPVRQSSSTASTEMVDGEEVLNICLHAWVTVTESLTDRGVERRVRNACGEDAMFDAGYEMSARSLRGFPHCNHLDPGNYRNESTQLQACMNLDGENRIAAAEVLTLIEGAESEGWAGLAQHLARGARMLMPNEEPIEGAGPVSAALVAQSGRRTRPYISGVTGEANRVVASGEVWRYGEIDESAEFEQVWMRTDGQWRITELIVNPFRKVPPNDE